MFPALNLHVLSWGLVASPARNPTTGHHGGRCFASGWQPAVTWKSRTRHGRKTQRGEAMWSLWNLVIGAVKNENMWNMKTHEKPMEIDRSIKLHQTCGYNFGNIMRMDNMGFNGDLESVISYGMIWLWLKMLGKPPKPTRIIIFPRVAMFGGYAPSSDTARWVKFLTFDGHRLTVASDNLT